MTMTDHLAEARSLARQAAETDADACSLATMHALIAIAERMPEPMTEAHWRAMAEAWASASAQVDPVHAPVLTGDDGEPVEPECPREDCTATEVHWHDHLGTCWPCADTCPPTLRADRQGNHWQGETRCYRPRRQEGGR